jgi:predicted site-specific integrase-resolvase
MENQNTEDLRAPISLDKFIEKIGLTPVTAWRWRKKGILKCVNICGRNYILPKDYDEFIQRSGNGDFATKVESPRSKKR